MRLYYDDCVDKSGKHQSFKFIECWRYLSDKPKWESYRNATSKAKSRIPSAEDDVLILPSSSVDGISVTTKPIGVKAAKRQKIEEKKHNNDDSKLAQATMDIAAAMEKKAEAQTILANLQVFTMPTDNLTPQARRFLNLQQAEIIANLEARAKARENTEVP
ncbi:unnamed protein product, partial [Aphanomyces euteiches]